MISVATKCKLAFMFFVCLLFFERKLHKKKLVRAAGSSKVSHFSYLHTVRCAIKEQGGKR